MSERVEMLSDGVTLYCGDCRAILPRLEAVDAIVTDHSLRLSESGT